jgi:molecular chaperone DnaK
MSELGDKVTDSQKSEVEGLVKNLREAVTQEDFDQIKSLTTELQQLLYTIGSSIYQGTGDAPDGSAGGPDAGASTGGGDDVIDAEFSEDK